MIDAGFDDAGITDAGTTDAGITDAGNTGDGGLPGDTCANATVLTTFPITVSATTIDYSQDYSDPTDATCVATRGNDRLFSVTVPAGQILNARVTPTTLGSSADPSISLILGPAANCDAMPPVCVATDNSGNDFDPNHAQYANRTAAAQQVFILIDSATESDPGGEFLLDVNVAPPPMGDTCTTAGTLVSGLPITAQTTAGFTNDYVGAGTLCSPSSAGPDRVYAISVLNNQRLTVEVTATAGFDPSISLVRGLAPNCAMTPRVCLASNNSGGPGGVDVAQYVNRSGAIQTLFVVIDSAYLGGGGYSLLATLDTPPANGDRCQAPDTLPTDGGVLTHTTAGFSNDYLGAGVGCASASGGPDRVYALTVPAGLRAQVTVTPRDAGFDPSLSVAGRPASECDDRSCLMTANAAPAGSPETISIISPLPDGGTGYYVIVDSASVTGDAYDITAVLQTNLVGENCGSVGPPITATTSFSDSTAGYSNDYSPLTTATNCTMYREAGRDRVYPVTVGAGQTLTVLITPDGVDNPAIYLLGSLAACVPAPTACLAGSDMGTEGDLETFSYVNSTGAAATYYLVVDAYDPGSVGYSLSITIN